MKPVKFTLKNEYLYIKNLIRVEDPYVMHVEDAYA